jgi:hypothetical protein
MLALIASPVVVDVAVTVTVDTEDLADDPPQPVNRPRPITPTVSRANICKARRLLNPTKQHSATANVVPGNSGLELGRTAADAVVVEIVSCVDVTPGSVMLAGVKLHVAPVGRPEQANVTAPVNPFSGASVIVIGLEDCPAVTVSAVVEAVTV